MHWKNSKISQPPAPPPRGSRSTRISVGLCGLLAFAAGVWSGCGQGAGLRPTRGLILISVDTLRADHLGAYGYERDTSPFLDSLAARGVLFENAFVQLPGTLPSHMSMLTGLYPEEHGVYPPDGILSPEIPLLAERLHAAGLRTAGHSEGGYMHGSYGFSRGFDDWSDEALLIESDAERTFARGTEFLRSLEPSDKFFLLLHTYGVHDPYFPLDRHSKYDQQKYNSLYWDGPAPDVFLATGPNLGAYNRGELELGPGGLEYFKARYDGAINYVDDVIRDFFGVLEELGLGDDVTVIITSDHGEEFLEHGKFTHVQTYPETLHVPLIVVRPGLEARRVEQVVESIDITPTLLELAGLPLPPVSGESLVPLLTGVVEAEESQAYSVNAGGDVRSLVHADDESRQQLILSSRVSSPEGIWVLDSLAFEALPGSLRLQTQPLQRRRTVRVQIHRHGDSKQAEVAAYQIEPGEVTPIDIELDVASRVVLSSDDCDRPVDLGINEDTRCLSFRVWGDRLYHYELFDLNRDPLGQDNLALSRSEQVADLLRQLRTYKLLPISEAAAKDLDPELEERLRALGYL